MSCWFSGVYEIPIQELPRREGGSIVQSRRTPFWDSSSCFFRWNLRLGKTHNESVTNLEAGNSSTSKFATKICWKIQGCAL